VHTLTVTPPNNVVEVVIAPRANGPIVIDPTRGGTRGPTGPAGATGPAGPNAPLAFLHTQGTVDVVWVINHNLNFYPNVTVQDSAHATVEGEITYTNPNSLTLVFTYGISGKAYLS